MKNKRKYVKLPWEQWYTLAKGYYQEKGDLLVPCDFCTKDGYRLGRWIERQRLNYNHKKYRMEEKQIELLQAIGMVWKLENRFEWETYIKLCKTYYKKHGNLIIPRNYSIHEVELGYWIQEQRRKKKKGLLTEQQIEILESYGMVWQISERKSWEEWYEMAKEFYMQHQHLHIPVSYLTCDGDKLGIWIYLQRMQYKGTRKPCLTQEKIALLNEIGMEWNTSRKR